VPGPADSRIGWIDRLRARRSISQSGSGCPFPEVRASGRMTRFIPLIVHFLEAVMSFGASAAMMGMMSTMMSTMIEATMMQVMMSMVQSVCNIAKTGAQDTEEDSKKG
jgi:hypothetical protein